MHLTEALRVPDLDGAVQALRERGVRLTSARRLALEGLYAAEGPVSAEQIAAGLSGRIPPSDVASVYRNLETLERLGLVRHVHLGHGPGLYAPAGRDDHEYLVCEGCGRHRTVEPAALEAIREVIRAQTGYTARFSHFPLVGLCPACADPREPEAAGETGLETGDAP